MGRVLFFVFLVEANRHSSFPSVWSPRVAEEHFQSRGTHREPRRAACTPSLPDVLAPAPMGIARATENVKFSITACTEEADK